MENMKKRVLSVVLCLTMIVAMFGFTTVSGIGMDETEAWTGSWLEWNGDLVEVYRMYNPNSGEHFYTTSKAERHNLIVLGWDWEWGDWDAPASGTPVYRLYNPNAGEHHYTLSMAEVNMLKDAGWTYEGIAFYSGGGIAMYRQYNPNAVTGSHNYTVSMAENNSLVSAGWHAEGVSWYVVDSEIL